MSFWVLIQILINFVLLAGVMFLWIQLNRPAKDDARLSRGLQMLQSKISILEDLSDRVETQVHQLMSLLEQKGREVQNKISESDKQIEKIEASMNRSLEVAQIFQDKIPHLEIVERQNTLKYIKAAKLAHQGVSEDEISKQVDLTRGEIEFIANINRENLQFSEKALPEWAKQNNIAISRLEDSPPTTSPENSLSELGNKFREALIPDNSINEAPKEYLDDHRKIRKVVFPRIDINQTLK